MSKFAPDAILTAGMTEEDATEATELLADTARPVFFQEEYLRNWTVSVSHGLPIVLVQHSELADPVLFDAVGMSITRCADIVVAMQYAAQMAASIGYDRGLKRGINAGLEAARG